MTAKILRHLALIALCFALMSVGYWAGFSARGEISAQSAAPLTELEQRFASVYERTSPSIVAISIVNTTFGEMSNGSGFVYDLDGHIITNYHVIDDANENNQVVVNFLDGTITRAEVVASDPDSDLAVIRVSIPRERLFPVAFADSDDLRIGQMVLAIGSPFGQRWTMTNGIISALDRTIDSLGNFQIGAVIQTDAPINPGNSGGPLLNLNGEVIGVNSQIISRERVNSGVGFAVPSRLVVRVADDLIRQQSVDYSYLGIAGLEDMNLRLIERFGLPDNTRGVRIGTVTGPAQAGGLLANDIIIAIDRQEVIGYGSLLAYLSGKTRPDQDVVITVLRDGERRDVTIRLGRRP